MDKRTAVGALAILFAILAHVAIANGAESIRYKLTYIVAVNDQETTASGIFEARATENSFSVMGEAIPAILPDGRVLVLSLNGGTPMRIEGWNEQSLHAISPFKLFMSSFADHASPYSVEDSIPRIRKARPVVAINTSILPRLYITSVPSSSEALEVVERNDFPNHDFEIRSLQLSITDEEVTTGRIERLLPWVNEDHADNSWRTADFIIMH